MECDTLVKAMHEIQNICIYANLRHTCVNQQGILTFTSFQFIQYFNQQNSSQEIHDCESFKESKFDAKNLSNAIKNLAGRKT